MILSTLKYPARVVVSFLERTETVTSYYLAVSNNDKNVNFLIITKQLGIKFCEY